MSKIKQVLLSLLVACCASQYVAAKDLRSMGRKRSWAEIFSTNRGAVVQIFSYRNGINIFEPFRAAVQSIALGSGVFVSDDGYLLTNFHVVDGTGLQGCYVQTPLTGKARLGLEFVGACPERDVALLRLIPGSSYEEYLALSGRQQVQCVTFGNSDEVRPAEEIMSLGHSDGDCEVKVSMGFVKGRDVDLGGPVLQTTAALNHGDSGGPFFNDRGEVIGLSVAKRVGAEGFGMIIPIASIERMFKNLCSAKIVQQPRWGFISVPASESTRAFLKCPEPGIYISKVYSYGLMYKSKMQAGDIVTAIDGQPLDAFGYLSVDWSDIPVSLDDYIQRLPLSIDCSLTYYRDGKKNTALVRVQQPEKLAVDMFYDTFEEQPLFEVFGGMVVSQLSLNHIITANALGMSLEQEMTKYAQLADGIGPRVIITSIFATSVLHLARVMSVGPQVTLIKKINGVVVNTIAEFKNAILSHKKDQFLTIEVEGGAFVALRLKDILAEEERLSTTYGYQQSDLVAQLKS